MLDDARTVDVHIPAALAERLGGAGPGLDRRALEALAIAAYQVGELTAYELRETLNIATRYELDAFLKARGISEPVTLADIQHDLDDLRAFRA